MTRELLLGYSAKQQRNMGVSSRKAGKAKGTLLGARGISGTPLFGDFTFSRARMK
jgi:hypothetical protein